MKKITVTFLLIFSLGLQAQKADYDWKKMPTQERREVIHNLSPEERKALLRKFRNNMIIEKLAIAPKDSMQFTAIYNEYLDKQHDIKKQFDSHFNMDNLSDEEAKIKLKQSFEVGQKLLDNRKEYADKMQKIISSQKVLKLFQVEGLMREKMNKKKPHFDKDYETEKVK